MRGTPDRSVVSSVQAPIPGNTRKAIDMAGNSAATSALPKLPAVRGAARLPAKTGHPSFSVLIGDAKLVSTVDRYAAGKALRGKVPRDRHGAWKRRETRTDPIRILRAEDAARLPNLVPIRYGRMLASPFTFYRGAAAVMAADLARIPVSGIKVQACGDCHLLNFGGFATPERNILFDINDFDETLPAPWEWDVNRLVASFALAARAIGLKDSSGRDIAAACARSYRKVLREFSEMHPLQVWYARVTADNLIETLPASRRAAMRRQMEKAVSRTGSELDFPKLTEMSGGHIGIRDAPPLIYHPETPHTSGFVKALGHAYAKYRDTLEDDRRVLLDQYRVVDAAIKVVGVGSVGLRCWIALLMSASNDPLFLQFKEAIQSALEPYSGRSAYSHHGQRVVMGQRLMQPASDMFLGWVTLPGGKHYYVRQLRDAKIKPMIETFDSDDLCDYAKTCGRVLARAHAKGGDACLISGYLGTSPRFDEAMGKFAVAYADQAERDHAELKAAVRNGKIEAYRE